MQTILYQDYSNYHIVFIDDASTDQTFNKTKEFLIEEGFDQSRIDYIRNEKKMYATYNLQNSAHHYCKSGEIFLIADGDDELVTTKAFKLVSSFYQRSEGYWVVYTQYFSSKYTYGLSNQVTQTYYESPR